MDDEMSSASLAPAIESGRDSDGLPETSMRD